jgi:hypothetical protein
MEEKFEFERDDLRGRLVDLEKKLAGRTQDLSLAETTLATRESEFESLQSSLLELNELREMKEVETLMDLDDFEVPVDLNLDGFLVVTY